MLYFDDKYTQHATHKNFKTNRSYVRQHMASFATTNQKTYLTHFILYATGFLENTASSGAGP